MLSNIKYLGILIDEVLSWNKQKDDIYTKLDRADGVLSKLRHGCLVWSYSIQRNIDRIIKLQKRCIRIITYTEFTEHTGPSFSELKLLKVKHIFSLTKLLFMFDFINENIPKERKPIFVINRSIHSHETRSCYDGANLWNKFYHAL